MEDISKNYILNLIKKDSLTRHGYISNSHQKIINYIDKAIDITEIVLNKIHKKYESEGDKLVLTLNSYSSNDEEVEDYNLINDFIREMRGDL